MTSIGTYAFNNCCSLKSISIPESVTSIGYGAFGYCNALTDIHIGSIESWLTIDYADTNARPNNGGFTGCHILIEDTEVTSITLPDSMTCIDKYAFANCSGLTSITIPESVTSIDEWAFYGCKGLMSITIPESVTSVGSYAFRGCNNLKNIHIGSIEWWLTALSEDSNNLPNDSSYGWHLFIGETELTSITIPESVTSIRSKAFYSCNSLTSITIPEGVTSIGVWAFQGCSNLTSISIPESVASIDYEAFRYCNNLTNIHIGSIESWLTIDYAYSYYNGFSHPNSAGSSGCHLFIGNTEVTSITIPESVSSIGASAFENCSSLTSIVIPEGVISIGASAFRNCSSLTSITIPDSVTSIGELAFYDCKGLTSITIPDSVTSIGGSAFNGCRNLTNIHIDSIEWWLTVLSADSYNLPNDNFDDNCHIFIGESELTSITIPESVISIGESAFKNCRALTSITIPGSVTSIGDRAFEYCTSLTSITIPGSVTSIGDYAFIRCSGLTSITIPGSVTSIGDGAFYDCTSLTSITIPDSVNSIGDRAFSYCRNLMSITIPDSVTSIGDYAFESCDRLKNVLFETTDENQDISFGTESFGDDYSALTVYCHMNTAPYTYFTENGYIVVVLEDIEDINTIRAITLPEDFRMPCGDSKELAFDVFPKDDEPIVWTSSDPEILTVSEGVVITLTPGTATVTATVGTVSESMTIHTFISASGIELNKSEAWLQASREEIQLSVVSYIPENTSAIISWSRSDTELAYVSYIDDQSIWVRPRKPGDVTITATTEKGVTASCLLHLTYPVTSLTLEAPSEIMYMGAMRQVTSTARTTKGESYINKLVTFTSSDESVAVIDEEGMITAISPGTVTITASAAGGKTAEVEITVLRASSPTFPAKLTVIEDEAFAGTPFQIVVIPDGVTSIGSRAFADCPNLISVRIPASVTSIAEDAFEGCPDVIIQREGQ